MKIVRYDYATVLCLTENVRVGFYRRGWRGYHLWYSWTMKGHRAFMLCLYCLAINIRFLRSAA